MDSTIRHSAWVSSTFWGQHQSADAGPSQLHSNTGLNDREETASTIKKQSSTEEERVANMSVEKRAAIEAARGRSKASIEASREARKEKQKVKVEKKRAKPLNPEQSAEEHRKWVVKYDKIKRDTENELGTLPAHEKLVIPNGVIQGYVYNSTNPDSAAKAKAFQEMGHTVQPDGYKPPYPPAIERNASLLREQLLSTAGEGSVRYREEKAKKVSEAGLSFETSHLIPGINQSSNKMYNTTVGWLQRRRSEGRLSPTLEAVTIIPKGEKK